MAPADRLRIAEMLAEAEVDCIEAGFPAASAITAASVARDREARARHRIAAVARCTYARHRSGGCRAAGSGRAADSRRRRDLRPAPRRKKLRITREARDRTGHRRRCASRGASPTTSSSRPKTRRAATSDFVVRGLRRRDPRRRDDGELSGHRRLRDARRYDGGDRHDPRNAPRASRERGHQRPHPQRPRAWRRPTRSPP